MSGFMRLQVWQEPWVYVTGDCHTVERCPVSYVGDRHVCEGEPPQPACWWAEYSAPGYMDRTDPVMGRTALEALKACFELYGDDENPDDMAEYEEIKARIERGDK